MVDAQCDCGYETPTLSLGGGMANSQTYCGFPYLCRICSAVTVANYLDDEPACSSCGNQSLTSYATPSLRGKREPGDVFDWFISARRDTLALPNGTYLCPKCGKKSLRFQFAGLWD